KYTYLLHDNDNLDLVTVYLLDQVQKGNKIPKEAVAHLRKNKLVEGRASNLYLAAPLAQSIEEKSKYIKNKGFDDQYYKDMILNYIKEFGSAKRADIRELIIDKLPENLTYKQKERKILTLLTSLKNKGIITTDSSNKQMTSWVLVEKK
ncbi:MAG: transcriptional regulator, partial [Lachnospiraceae bacterium]|nr:transcriptional regulator [Lachnospiraceae bacterium]